jgi:two-component system NarL family sensor kinase
MPIDGEARLPARRAAALATAATVAVLALIGQLTGADAAPGAQTALLVTIAVSFATMGALALAGAPDNLVGRLMVAAGAAAGVATLALSWMQWAPLAWLGQWSWWPPFGLIFLALLVFPDGRLPSPRWRPLAVLIALATVVAAVAFALAAVDDPGGLITSGTPPPTQRAQVLVWVANGAIAVAIAGLIGVIGSLGLRWRRADSETRHQLACLLPAVVLLLLGVVLDALGLSGAWLIIAVAVPVGMSIAMLRYRLYGLDQVVNRTIVWLVMTLLVIAVFIAIVALLRDLAMGGSTSNASLAATGLVAVTFEPVRRRVQRGVDRLLFGDRDDPYEVITRLGDLLGRTVEPNALLPLLTGTIARSLQVPYVAIELAGRGRPRLLAEHGTAATAVESFDMVAHGDRVGRLLVATRSPGSRFTPRERRLLGDAAVHAAVAAEATRLIRDLQESRERLVMAREEERRRLRRELHDGLGPALTGMSMQVRAAHKLLPGQGRVGEILDALAEDLKRCTAEVREFVDQLRPPALDRGLAAALRAECQRFDGPGLAVRPQLPESLDGLPAAVEVAAFRIVGEALTNAARHSRARSCHVTVRLARSLTLAVVDDGVGIDPQGRYGVGLDSMRERAAELGGECEIVDAVPHGTAVRVRLPVTLTDEHLSA